jgi:hypothetical protein
MDAASRDAGAEGAPVDATLRKRGHAALQVSRITQQVRPHRRVRKFATSLQIQPTETILLRNRMNTSTAQQIVHAA